MARLLGGEKMAVLCEAFGISRKMGYKIYQRYKEIGAKGLTDRSRRPHRHANQLPMMVEKAIVRLKTDYPSWGPPKIRERLKQKLPHVGCPAVSTVDAVLDRNGLVKRRYCYPLTITDFATRSLLACEALSTTKERYAFGVFERVFQEYGLARHSHG